MLRITFVLRAIFDMTDIFYKREISSYYIIYIAFLCFMNNITNHYFTLKSLRIDFSVDKIWSQSILTCLHFQYKMHIAPVKQ